MDESSQAPQSLGTSQSQQQRPVSHSRPFFYVQPPSQPYHHMYQWHGNNPYSNYGFQGSGLPFGRPFMSPYPYMQYPGYVMPHAPVHLLDYRRLCDPHFNPAAYDAMRRFHHPGAVLRESACAGAQTDPSEALSKLMECLDKLRASDASTDQEADSGITSPTTSSCGVGSPREDMRKEGSEDCEQPEPTRIESHQAASGALFSNMTEVYEPHKGKDEAWSMDSDGGAPLDSSSVHEESEALEQEENDIEDELHVHHCHSGKKASSSDCAPDPYSHGETNMSPFEGCHSLRDPGHGPEDCVTQDKVDTNKMEQQSRAKAVTKMSTGKGDDDGDFLDLPHRIVHLPFGKVLSGGGLLKDDPVKPPSVSPPPLSLGNPFYYSYCAPQLALERLSVLSPSLDELSSRDEMFSTDLEELNLYPGHVYQAMELQKPALTSDGGGGGGARLQTKHKCSNCGLRVSKRAMKAVAESYCCDDALADSDEGVVGEDEAETAFKLYSSTRRKTLPASTCRAPCHKPSCLQQAKLKSRRLYCRGETDHQPGPSDCQEVDYPMHKCCEELAALAERSHRTQDEHRKSREKHWRDRGDCLQHDCCEVGCGKGLAKARQVQPLPQRRVREHQRRSVAKPSLYQNNEEEDEE
ncbi:bucky ball [Engraulis encrasicolus]|uniref:bucky ball n=1 Tax=Engraulis encrasicolus TaxID=184585 RepID=UPI002FCFACB3